MYGDNGAMSREFPIGLTPPDWLVRNLRPQPAPPVNRPAVARAAIAMSLPLAVGLATGHAAYGALASMGALSGVIGDTADAYRMRILNIAIPQLFGALGVTLGSLVYGQGWAAVAVVTGVALVSGMISTIGAVASVSGLLLLLNSVIGAGLPLPGAWWLAPVLMSGGGLLVLVLALLAWPLRSGVPERAAVAQTYRKVAELLAAGTTDGYEDARQAVTQSLNQSYDLVLARRARHHGRSPELVRLLAQLNAITPVVEAAPAAHQAGRPLPPEVPEAVRHLADAVETGYTGPTGLHIPAPADHTSRAVEQALRHAADVVGSRSPDLRTAVADDDRLGRPATLRARTVRVGPGRRPVRRLLALRTAPRPVHRPRAGAGVDRPGAALVLGRADHHLRPEARLRLRLLPGAAARPRHGRGAGDRGGGARPGAARLVGRTRGPAPRHADPGAHAPRVRLPDGRHHPGDPPALRRPQPPGRGPAAAPAPRLPHGLRNRAGRGLSPLAGELAHPRRRPPRRRGRGHGTLCGVGVPPGHRGRGTGTDASASVPRSLRRPYGVPAGPDRTAAHRTAGGGLVAPGRRGGTHRRRDDGGPGPHQAGRRAAVRRRDRPCRRPAAGVVGRAAPGRDAVRGAYGPQRTGGQCAGATAAGGGGGEGGHVTAK